MQALLVDLRLIIQYHRVDAIGQGAAHFFQGSARRFRDAGGGLIANPKHFQPDRRQAVVGGKLVLGFIEAFAHAGDLAQAHHAAVAGADNRQGGELARPITTFSHPNQNLSATGFQTATAGVERRAANAIGDLAQAQSMRLQSRRGHIDMDAILATALQFDLGHPGRAE